MRGSALCGRIVCDKVALTMLSRVDNVVGDKVCV